MPDCLKIEELERVAAGNGTQLERDHVAGCAVCQTELELLSAFAAAEPNDAEAEAVRKIAGTLSAAPVWRGAEPISTKSSFFSPARWGLLLAGVAAALTFGVYLRNPASPLPPAADTVRSAQIELISPLGDLSRAPETLRWRSVAAAAAYEVKLSDVEGQSIWQARTLEPQLSVPVSAQALMTVRKTLTWRITAFNAAGVPIASSATEEFRVLNQ